MIYVGVWLLKPLKKKKVDKIGLGYVYWQCYGYLPCFAGGVPSILATFGCYVFFYRFKVETIDEKSSIYNTGCFGVCDAIF